MEKRLCIVMLGIMFFGGCSVSNVEPPRSTQETSRGAVGSPASMTEIQKMIEKKGGENGIPSGYLRAIAEVESKASSFAVNAYGRSHNFKNKEEAVEFIKSARRRGARNISIGCMQLHVSHANRFKSIEDFVEPINNISFAAQYLASLHKKYGSWEKAIMRYHSAKASYGKRYLNKVMKVYNRGRS